MAPKDDITALAEGFDLACLDDWHQRVERQLKGASFEERLVGRTADGIRFAPLYTRLEGPPDPQPGRCQRPGSGWDIRQAHGDSEPGRLAAAIGEDLAGGVTSVCISLAGGHRPGLAPAQLGGVLAVVPSEAGIALDAGDTFGSAAGTLLEHWRLQGIDGASARGSIDADPLGAMAVAGGLARPLDDLLADVARLIDETLALPNVTAALADGRPYHNGGASAAQELAAMLSTLVAYLRAGDRRGISPAEALPKIAIGLAAHADQLVTIAKLRAARRLVARVSEASCGSAAAIRVLLSVTTSTRMLTRIAPENNILRNALAAAAAAIGGADVITVSPHTQALGPPDTVARRIARNTQHVLMREAQLARVVDPAAGSYAIEHLTDDIARKAWSIFQDIEAHGGMALALSAGFIQERIVATRAARRRLVATGRRAITAVSVFPSDDFPALASAPPAAPFSDVWPLDLHRDSEPFEQLRGIAQDHIRATGGPPAVFLACLGEPRDFAQRAHWIRSLLAIGGFVVAGADDTFTSSTAAGLAFSQSGAALAIIVAGDQDLDELGEAVAMAIKAAGAHHVLAATQPGDRKADFEAAGIDGFLFEGIDQVAVLRALHEAGGRS